MKKKAAKKKLPPDVNQRLWGMLAEIVESKQKKVEKPPLRHFDIQPYVGAMPITFGMSQKEVHKQLGKPKGSFPTYGGGTTEHFAAGFNVGYDTAGKVMHLGFGPRDADLSVQGQTIWSSAQHPDPNPLLLALDAEPLEFVGNWYFEKLGITTSGYHNGDENDLALTVYRRGSHAELLQEAEPADTSKYFPAKKRIAKKKPAKKKSAPPAKRKTPKLRRPS